MEGSDGRTMFSVSADTAVSSVSVIRRGGERVKRGFVMESAAARIQLDVLARDAARRLFTIEVQVQHFPRWGARSACYLSRLLATQITSGQQSSATEPQLDAWLDGIFNAASVRALLEGGGNGEGV